MYAFFKKNETSTNILLASFSKNKCVTLIRNSHRNLKSYNKLFRLRILLYNKVQ